ncbi:MAG: hypothetical protein ABF497_05400 [Sporolactobacillus sp.]
MKTIYDIANYQNTKLIDDNDQIPGGFTDQTPMKKNSDGTYTGYFKPAWSGSASTWIEGATADEISSINTTVPQPPSIDARLSAVESVISSLMGV